jgi:DNA-binding NarL/FixJ family response regulator
MKTILKTKTIFTDKIAGTIQEPDGLLTTGNQARYSPFADGGLCSRLNRRSKPVTVLLAEHRTIVRQGICALLALEKNVRIIAGASDGCQAAELTENLHPDAVVISAALAGMNHMLPIRRMLLALPAPRVIILGRHGDDAFARLAASMGAAGYVSEQISAQILVRTLHETCKGARLFPAGISQFPPGTPASNPAMTASRKPLTSRQMQVLQLVAAGNSNKETAFDLSISIKTVEKHRGKLMSSLGIHETAGLTRYAIASGILNCEKTQV